MENVSLLINSLFWSADQTHLWHFQCGDDRVHVLLNTYYDNVRGGLDTIAELWMGITGKIPKAVSPMKSEDYTDIEAVKAHIDIICKLLKKASDGASSTTHFQSAVDGLRGDIAKVKYLFSLIK